MAEILLLATGSAGDVYPFMGAGIALQQRGHRATLFAGASYEKAAREAGLEFVGLGAGTRREEPVFAPAFKRIAPGLAEALKGVREGYARIAEHYKPGNSVLIAVRWALAAPLAQEKLCLPRIALLLSPVWLRSAYSPPGNRFQQVPPRLSPRRVGTIYRALDGIYEAFLSGPMNRFRAEVGLPPRQEVVDWWRNSQDLAIGCWPDWLYGPQPDWPSNAVLTGFIDYEPRSGPGGVSPVNIRDLIGGEAPIVFTTGTAAAQAPEFYKVAAEACRILDRPGILLTSFDEYVPQDLPPGVRHARYVPLGELLPRAAALVHHGGIGTAARALKAGLPQLIMPIAVDQFDNGERLCRLGIARCLPRKRFRAESLAGALRELLESTAVAERCQFFARKLQASDALERTCDLIEGVVERRLQPLEKDRECLR